MNNIYQTIYIDNTGGSFVGESWIADSEAEYNKALALESKVFDELPIIERIVIVTPVETLIKGDRGNDIS